MRARTWSHDAQAAACDVLEPWAHGTIVRATRYPDYWDFNAVRVEEDPAMSVDELIGVADEALAGLAHRRVDVEIIEVAESLRPGFEAEGWEPYRLVWMLHEAPLPPGPEIAVEKASHDAVDELRARWYREDFGDRDPGGYLAQAQEVSRRRGAQTLVVREGGTAIAFAQLERVGDGADITQLYVHPDHRGAGLGTALTRAAIRAAGDVRDLWIVAADEGRPKQLYMRLGFRPVWTAMEFLKLP